MNLTRSRRGAVVALVFGLSGAWAASASAQTQPSQLEELNERLDQATRQIDQLREEVRRLRENQAATTLPTIRPAAAAIQAAVLREAASAPRFQGLTSGYDNGHFFIASADNDFKLSFEGQLQLRYLYNNRNDPDDGDHDVQGFQTRRAKIGVFGHIGSPKLTFKLKGEFKRNGGGMVLSDAWVAYALSDQWSVKVGAFSDILLREYAVSSKSQQTVERSAVASYFWDDGTRGLQLTHKDGRWRHFASFTAGPDQKRGDFTDSSDYYEWALNGRSEYLVAGDWKEFSDFANWSKQSFGIMAGAGVAYDKGANYAGSTHPNLLKYTADVSMKLGNGINLFGAFVGQHVDGDRGQPTPGANQFGFVAQAGAFVIPDKVDIFARYEYANLRGASVDNADNVVEAIEHDKINLITIGANYYIRKHNVKLTFDVVYALDPLDSQVTSTSTGLLPDMDRGQVAVRTQLQLLF